MRAITLIPGDGIGAEIVASTREIVLASGEQVRLRRDVKDRDVVLRDMTRRGL